MVILSTLGVLGPVDPLRGWGGSEVGTLLGVWMRAVFKNYSLGQGIDGGLERIKKLLQLLLIQSKKRAKMFDV